MSLLKIVAFGLILGLAIVGYTTLVNADGPDVFIASQSTEDATTVLTPDGHRRTVFGQRLNAKPADTWKPVDLAFRPDSPVPGQGLRVLSGNDQFTSQGSNAAKAILTRDVLELVHPETGIGIRWSLPSSARVEVNPAIKEDQNKVSFIDRGIIWEIHNTSTGSKLAGSVPRPRGKQSYSFGYELVNTSTPMRLAGQTIFGPNFILPAPFVIDAEGKRYGPLQYKLTPTSVGFDFDDSVIPPSGYPYIIDPTTTFSTLLGADDGNTLTNFAAYPPPCTSVVPAGSRIDVVKEKSGANTSERVGLMRWDTSSLPDDAVITLATFEFNALSVTADDDGRTLDAEWFNAESWPIACSMHETTIGTTAFSTDLTSVTSGVTGSNPTSVVVDGYTSVRVGISGGEPAGGNAVGWDSFETGSTAPQLIVTYTTPLDETVPKLAGDLPITGYEDVVESGDLLILAPYEITIPGGTPSVAAANEYQFIFRDGTSWYQVSQPVSTSDNGNKGYEKGLSAFYFTAAQVRSYGLTFNSPGTYTVELDSVNGIQNTTSTNIVWRSNANTDLTADLSAIAADLEQAWVIDLIQDGRLTSLGQSYFTDVLPSLSRMIPDFMALSVDRASPVLITHATDASDDKAAFWDGTVAADGFTAFGLDFGMTSMQFRTSVTLVIALLIIVAGLHKDVPAWFALAAAGIWVAVSPEIGMAPMALSLLLGFFGIVMFVFAILWSRD